MSQLASAVTRFSFRAMLSVNLANVASYNFESSFNLLHVKTIVTTTVRKADRLYTNKHEWIDIKETVGTVGISNYAQNALGDVVFAQLPEVGSTIIKNDEVGALESVKAASELISPVSGKVIEKNNIVERKPGLINTSCYNEGWLYKVELSDLHETKDLMDEKSYEEFLTSNPH